jgi:hypothetical protein
MRIFRNLFALAGLLVGSMLGLVGAVLAHALPRYGVSHLHLMPRTPRSIVMTRRMGLA